MRAPGRHVPGSSSRFQPPRPHACSGGRSAPSTALTQFAFLNKRSVRLCVHAVHFSYAYQNAQTQKKPRSLTGTRLSLGDQTYESPVSSNQLTLKELLQRRAVTVLPHRYSSSCNTTYFVSAVATSTAIATVAPTIGLFPIPRNPIISTCAGTDEEPANCASECMRPIVSVIP